MSDDAESVRFEEKRNQVRRKKLRLSGKQWIHLLAVSAVTAPLASVVVWLLGLMVSAFRDDPVFVPPVWMMAVAAFPFSLAVLYTRAKNRLLSLREESDEE